MNLLPIFFPLQARCFPGLRWLNIALRSLHLVGMAGVAGGGLCLDALPPLFDFWPLTLLSGMAMVGLSIWGDGRWLLQLRGVVIVVKLLLLFALPWLNSQVNHGAAWGLVVIILLTSVIAHAPGKVRYRFVFHVTGVRAL